MANFEPPSFSLGLDFSMDPDPLATPMEQPLHAPARPSTPVTSAIDDEVDFGSVATEVREVTRPFKRLRRGFASDRDSTADKCPFELGSNLEDDIEEFSSQEDPSPAKRPLSQHKSVCSSSKAPLHGQGIFRRVAPQLTQRKMKQSLETPASSVTENASTQFPKLTISPLRRFQLISDSDSDSDFDGTSVSYECRRKENLSLKSVDKQKTAKSLGINSQKEDLWKDFQSEKSFAIPTPALDEVCEEYFRSVQDNKATNKAKGDNRTKENKCMYGNPHSADIDESNVSFLDQAPPSHRYFMNDDPRICSLVRSRLPNFFPLDNIPNRNTQPDSSVINYMSQFNQGESSKGRGTVKANDQSNTTKKKKNSKKVTAEETPQGSTSWINPRSSTTVAPENVAKRRVQAVGQSVGHWYTDSSGRRVYVNKSGQELTGKIAYVQYKKDNGTGFKKSKNKKSEGKKKPAAKKKQAASARK